MAGAPFGHAGLSGEWGRARVQRDGDGLGFNMHTRLLNVQANKIEMVLAAHKAPARVWGGRLTARTIQFHLAPAATTKLHALQALTEELALALGAASAHLTRHDGTLSLEVPRPDGQGVAFADLVQRLHA